MYSSLYKISKDNGLLAHVYEHLLAQYVLNYLQDKGFFILSDIILTAKTYGDTCYMDVELHNPAAPNVYKKPYGRLTSMLFQKKLYGGQLANAA